MVILYSPWTSEGLSCRWLKIVSVKEDFCFWNSMNMILMWDQMNGLQDLDVQPLRSLVEAASISERS